MKKIILSLIVIVLCFEYSKAQIKFVRIPAGKFLYGKFSPPYPTPELERKSYTNKDYKCAEKLARRAAIPGFEVLVNEFEIGKYEVTQKQWLEVMGNNPSYFKGDSLPVQNVSWSDAQLFLEKLNASDASYHYRLPSEFEWEFAARAGATDDIAWDTIRLMAHISTSAPANVGTKQPNAFGLYDMLGNVWEWAEDVYNEKIFADRKPPARGTHHVLKGASFVGDVKNATYMTHAAGPGNVWDVGFRVVREPASARSKVVNKAVVVVEEKLDPKGWHISRTTHQGAVPSVEKKNGIITLSANPFGQGGVILTNKKYRDFELSIDVKIDSFCNSGIFLRAAESGVGYQVELSEPGGTGDMFGEMLQISTATTADKSKVWKADDWSTFRIRMTGEVPRIALWINGALMWDVTQPKNDFIAGAVEGYIGLQTHWSATYSEAAKAFDMSGSWKPGGKVRFKNISIREL